MNNVGLTGIIPFTYFGGDQKLVGSSFLRVDGLIANACDFEQWKHGHKYDNLIFQKAYWKEMMELFTGPKILDLCDPDWVTGSVDLVDIGNCVDAVTCSSENLTHLLKNYFPEKLIVYIPDRLNFKIFPIPREKHAYKARKVVWFGFIHNAHETLEQLFPAIQKHNLFLTIIADKPYSKKGGIKELPNKFVRYNQQTAYNLIKEADIVLNPKSEKAFYKFKSMNKTIISWKLGVPVAENIQDLERFIDPNERNKEVKEKQLIVAKEYNIIKSAEQYREIISTIRLNMSLQKTTSQIATDV